MNYKIFLFILSYSGICRCDLQAGPDPWHNKDLKIPVEIGDTDLPPDLKVPIKKAKQAESKLGFGEWWFKRLLAIILKSGHVKKDEDGSIDISLQMKFDEDKWGVLDECLKSEFTLSDVMFRQAVGYVEEGIYKPTITDKVVMAWSDYIQIYLTEYKMYITWLFGILGATGILMWVWKHVSHQHIIIIIFTLLYIYEVVISYKEAEQQEYQKFISAVSTCKWHFWKSECELPSPDPILFMSHMNPLKIAIRMFTTLISEPILSINATVKIILQDITDGLWFPFDKIVYGLLIVVINISLIYFLVMIVFNFIFNIPFNLNFLGIVSIGVKQNRPSLFTTNSNHINEHQPQIRDTDSISGERLDKILNVCSLALSNVHNKSNISQQSENIPNLPKIRRSASTGRLPILSSENINYNTVSPKDHLKQRQNSRRGEGDH